MYQEVINSLLLFNKRSINMGKVKDSSVDKKARIATLLDILAAKRRCNSGQKTLCFQYDNNCKFFTFAIVNIV